MAIDMSTERSGSVEKCLCYLRPDIVIVASIDKGPTCLNFKSTIVLLLLCSMETKIEEHPYVLSSLQRPAADRN